MASELHDLDVVEKFGNPWHGPVSQTGVVTLPNAATRTVDPVDGGVSLVKFAGLPASSTTAEETALGMEWRDYALMNGLHGKKLYGELDFLPAWTWLYRNNDGVVYQMRFALNNPPFWQYQFALNETVTLSYEIYAKVFGVIGDSSAGEISISTGSFSFPAVHGLGPYLNGLYLANSPDGSKLGITSVMGLTPNLISSKIPQVGDPYVMPTSAHEITLSSASPPTASSASVVVSGVDVVTYTTIGTPPLGVDTKAYFLDPENVVYKIGLWSWVGGVAVDLLGEAWSDNYEETQTRLLLLTYAPDNSRCIFRGAVHTIIVNTYSCSGTVSYPFDGTASLSTDYNTSTTTTYSVTANGISRVSATRTETTNSVRSENLTPPTDLFIWAKYFGSNVANNLRTAIFDGITAYSNGVAVNVTAAKEPRFIALGPCVAGIYKEISSDYDWKWRRACSPIGGYDAGAYTSNKVAWQPITNTWGNTATGVVAFV